VRRRHAVAPGRDQAFHVKRSLDARAVVARRRGTGTAGWVLVLRADGVVRLLASGPREEVARRRDRLTRALADFDAARSPPRTGSAGWDRASRVTFCWVPSADVVRAGTGRRA
jgi:hypothetical protein